MNEDKNHHEPPGRNSRPVPFAWNDTSRPWPKDCCIQHLFEAQALKTPDALAVEYDGASLSYAALDDRANAIAGCLRCRGVGKETMVGLLVQRSLETIAAILGILKAGGAYVPLDPDYPADRLAFMVDDTRMAVIVTCRGQKAPLSLDSRRLLYLEDVLALSPASSEPLPTGSDDLAYVIYTSGSTGKPKGVMISQANLVHSTCARLAYYQEPVRRYLLLSSFAFDSSVAGIFWTLCQGGCLVLPSTGTERDPTRIASLIDESHISHLLALPSLHAWLLEQAGAGSLLTLKVVIVAGEACPPSLIEAHQRRLPGVSLFNEYGPTEGTVWCTVQDLTTGHWQNPVPIGRPIPNMQCQVVNDQLQVMNVGEEGELLIGGAGISRGYLNRPELTAEKFVPDPFDPTSSARFYRTGDLVRWNSQGCLEFLGRIDQQVKIRGFRIELGEIESALARHPLVQACAVTAWDGPRGEKRLVAYSVARDGARPAIEDFRRHLGEMLPDYMVPAAFMLLDALPLLPNGKINRKALPAPDRKRPDLLQAFVPPAAGLETELAALWSETLFLDRVGVDDSFFELGGSSLQMAYVHFRLQKHLAREFKITELFSHPTVRQQAAHFRPARPTESGVQQINDRASRQRASMTALRNTRR